MLCCFAICFARRSTSASFEKASKRRCACDARTVFFSTSRFRARSTGPPPTLRFLACSRESASRRINAAVTTELDPLDNAIR